MSQMNDLKEKIIGAVQDATNLEDGSVSIPILDSFLNEIFENEFPEEKFAPGDFIKLKTWDDYRLKVVDIGFDYLIVEHEDLMLRLHKKDDDYIKSENQEEWGA